MSLPVMARLCRAKAPIWLPVMPSSVPDTPSPGLHRQFFPRTSRGRTGEGASPASDSPSNQTWRSRCTTASNSMSLASSRMSFAVSAAVRTAYSPWNYSADAGTVGDARGSGERRLRADRSPGQSLRSPPALPRGSGRWPLGGDGPNAPECRSIHLLLSVRAPRTGSPFARAVDGVGPPVGRVASLHHRATPHARELSTSLEIVGQCGVAFQVIS
jgi:hypothetical protein